MAPVNYSMMIMLCFALFAVCALALEGEVAGETNPGILVNGTIICGRFQYPLEGASANVTCASKGKDSFTFTAATDAEGAFTVIFSLSETERTFEDFKKDCKAYLHTSPDRYCQLRSNQNGGITGAPLTHPVEFPDRKEFSLDPFKYCPSGVFRALAC